MDRCAVFIDGGYFDKVLSLGFPRKIVNFEAFSDSICCGEYSEFDRSKYYRFRTYYYYAPPYVSTPPLDYEREMQSKKNKFIGILDGLSRFQTRKGKVVKRGTEYIQKMVDILFAVDLVNLSATNQIQKAILVAGDSDYVPAVKVAKQHVNVHLFYYRDANVGVHDHLIEVCDDRDIITEELMDASLLRH